MYGTAKDTTEIPFHSYRSPVYASGGMVATTQPAAVLAGINTLAAGGNAADAAVAAAAVLAVTEPTSCGIGGDCFALYYQADTGEVAALNGSGRAPAALTMELLRREGMSELPRFHPHTVTVPGAVAGWDDLLTRFGTRDLHQLLAPAIELADSGFAVAPKTAYMWECAAKLQLRPHGSAMLVEGARAPRPGERFYNRDLARTLSEIATKGAKGFYQGYVAEAVVKTLRDLGGVMTVDDLAAHQSAWVEPIAVTYRNKHVYQCPPNGQGLVALLALGILAALPDVGLPMSARRHHCVVEALRLAFADGKRYIADPKFTEIDLKGLLSCSYAEMRAAEIDLSRAMPLSRAGSPQDSSDTVYLAVVDGQGNSCSFIQSNYMGFGTGIVPAGTGMTLQNRGHNFSLEPEHANALAPGKRPYHTIMPGLATEASGPHAGQLSACFGVMGGFMQPQGHVQVLMAMLDDRLDPQLALDRPRLCIEPMAAGKSRVALEAGIDIEGGTVAADLGGLGHSVYLVDGHERGLFGRGQVIVRDGDTGVLCGGSDLRGDGMALGL